MRPLARRLAAVEARSRPAVRAIAPVVTVQPGETIVAAIGRTASRFAKGDRMLIVPAKVIDKTDFARRFKLHQTGLAADAKSRPIAGGKDAPTIAEPIPMKPVRRSPYSFPSEWRRNRWPG